MSQRNYDRVVAPSVRVVVAPRGYGKSTLAASLPYASPWSAAQKGYYVIDVEPDGNPDYALRHAQAANKFCQEFKPGVQARVFMRREHWHAVQRKQQHAWLSQRKGAVIELSIRDPRGQSRPCRDLEDRWGTALPGPWAQVQAGASITQAAADWVAEQPEHQVLLSMLPAEGESELPFWTCQQRLSVAFDRLGIANEKPRKYLEWLELIGAGHRAAGGIWCWAPIWLAGCRELAVHDV